MSTQPLFKPKRYSFRVQGRVSSIILEGCFWQTLNKQAEREGTTTAELLRTLLKEFDKTDLTNFQSYIRCHCLMYESAARYACEIFKEIDDEP